ncbi:MAG: mechanosensitive ion channel family protein [Nanoarchaeota archaeon]|nr:mechanosensitive ion channel family protein [Nanoarchaeota archaeon]MBU4299888.1 mechanosensitive ion channel family protein [Nanoarchaeota archaeon]MBU4452333.1 mechanosensitive ion channel family protein [Nanoarchaeota archaeon]MCG2724543.1 mechanosensitive ion channel family protein [archaeon]
MFIAEILKNITSGAEIIIPAVSSPYLNALIILLASFILAKIADFLFEKVFLRLTAHTETDLDDRIVASLKSPIYYAVISIGTYASLHSISLGDAAFFYIDNLIQTILIIIGAIAAWRITDLFIGRVIAKFAAKTKSTLDDEMMPLFKNITKLLIIFAAIMLTLSAWDINVTPLLASAGIVGLALAFAAQSTVANLFGGVAVYFDKPFKVGDRIQLESGEIGDVVEIGIRSTRLQTFDDTLIIIPNEKIANSKVTNFNQPIPRMNVKFNIGVVYGSDVAKVKKTLLNAAEGAQNILKNPKPVVLFMEHGDFALKFLLIVWIDMPTKKGTVLDEINTAINREFNKAKIEIAFPTQTVYLKK